MKYEFKIPAVDPARLAGAAEGQCYWWIVNTGTGEFYRTPGGRVRATTPLNVAMDVPPGNYVVGCGTRNGGKRHRITVAVAPKPVVKPRQSRSRIEVLADHADRIETSRKRQEAQCGVLLKSFGLKHAPPVFAPGTPINSVGNSNFNTSRVEVSNLPRPMDGLERMVEVGELEERESITVKLNQIHLQNDGTVEVDGHGAIGGIELAGVKSMTAFHPGLPGAGKLFTRLPAEGRAHLWDMQTYGKHVDWDVSKGVTLLVRKNGQGERNIFGMVSDTYGEFGVDKVAKFLMKALRPHLGDDARIQISYDPVTTNFTADVIWHADKNTGKTMGAGDVFKVALRFSSNDVGNGAIRMSLASWRNLCLNLIIIDNRLAPIVRVIHKGDINKHIRKLSRAIPGTLSKLDEFLVHWGQTATIPLMSVIDADAALDAVIADAEKKNKKNRWTNPYDIANARNGQLTAAALMQQFRMQHLPADIRRDLDVERLVGNVEADGVSVDPNTLSVNDAINAITRIHTDKLVSQCVREKAEVAAGRLHHVFAKR
jgi:hypothetical protein